MLTLKTTYLLTLLASSCRSFSPSFRILHLTQKDSEINFI